MNKYFLMVLVILSAIGLPTMLKSSDPFDLNLGLNESKTINLHFMGSADTGSFVQSFFITDTCGKKKVVVLKAAVRRPFAHAGNDTTVCYGSDFRIGKEATVGTPPYEYTWSPSNLVDDPKAVNPLVLNLTKNTDFDLKVVDSKGCVGRDTIKVNVNPKLFAIAGNDTTICYGSSVKLGKQAVGGSGQYAYLWTPPLNLDNWKVAQPNATLNETTQYIVEVTDSKLCVAYDTIVVKVNPRIEVVAGNDVVICPDSSIVLNPSYQGGIKPYSFKWTPSLGLNNTTIQNPTLKLTQSGTYQYKFTVTDSMKCSRTDSLQIRVRNLPQMTLNKTLLDFGSLGQCTSTKEDSVEVFNSGTEDIIIDSSSSASGFGIITALPVTIKAGERKMILIRFSPKSSGTSTANITFFAKPCNLADNLQLKGEKLKMLLTASVTDINFGTALTCLPVNRDTCFSIENTGTEDITIHLDNGVITQPYKLVSPVNDQVVSPGGNITLCINYQPVIEGIYSQDIRLPFTAGACEDTVIVTLNGSYAKPQISSSLRNIQFPDLIGCETSRDTIIDVTNTGTIEVQIVTIEPNPPFISITNLPLSLQPGETKKLIVKFEPNNEGLYNGNMILKFEPCGSTDTLQISGNKQGITFSVPNEIDFGEIIYCSNEKTKTMPLAIENKSGGGVDGAIKSMFKIIGPFQTDIKDGDKLPNGQTKSFNVTFTPDGSTPNGDVTGQIELLLEPCDLMKTITLKAKKTDVSFKALIDTLNFGIVQKDSVKQGEIIFTNTGTAIAIIDRIDGIVPPYKLLSTIPPLQATLRPNEVLKVEIEYNPKAIKPDNLEIRAVSITPCPYETKGYLTGICKQNKAKTVLYIKSDSAFAGENINLPLMLRSSENLIQSGITGFSAKIKLNKSLLKYVGNNGTYSIEGDYRILEVSGLVKDSIGKLADIEFIAALGDEVCTALEIDSVSWIGGISDIDKEKGMFCLRGICYQGGTRLFEAQDKLMLMDCKPNPASDKVQFELVTIEKAPARLMIYDLMGRNLGQIFETSEPGHYVLDYDASELGTGVYLYLLQTPGTSLSKFMSIVK